MVGRRAALLQSNCFVDDCFHDRPPHSCFAFPQVRAAAGAGAVVGGCCGCWVLRRARSRAHGCSLLPPPSSLPPTSRLQNGGVLILPPRPLSAERGGADGEHDPGRCLLCGRAHRHGPHVPSLVRRRHLFLWCGTCLGDAAPCEVGGPQNQRAGSANPGRKGRKNAVRGASAASLPACLPACLQDAILNPKPCLPARPPRVPQGCAVRRQGGGRGALPVLGG